MSENQLKFNSKAFWLKNKNLGVAIVVAILAILIVGGLIVFNVFKPKEATKETVKQSETQTQNTSTNQTSNIKDQDQPATADPANQDKPVNPVPPVSTNLPIR